MRLFVSPLRSRFVVSRRETSAHRSTRVQPKLRASAEDDIDRHISTRIDDTITRIRDAVEGDGTDHSTLLSLAMQLSLEFEMGSSPSTASSTTNVSKATWTLARIKGMAEQARHLFIATVNEQKPGENRDTDLEYDEQVRLYPLMLIESINRVFEDHGYRKMSSWAECRAFSFAQVVEYGSGSPLVIAILYQAVARLSGLPLECVVLEDGCYAVLSMGMWVVDPYSKGLLMSAEEIAELFDVDLPLKPSSLREVSIALVKQHLNLSWCSITGVYEPAFRLPFDGEEGLDLTLGCFEDVSFSYQVKSDDGTDEEVGKDVSQFFIVHDERGQQYLRNCVKAAEKLRILERDSKDSRIRLAILLYFNKRYGEALEVLEGLLTEFQNNGRGAQTAETAVTACAGETGESDAVFPTEDPLNERIMASISTLRTKCRLLSSLDS